TSDNRSETITTKLTVDGNTVAAPVTGLADGGHALTAIAIDAAGNQARVDRTFAIGAGSTTAGGCALSGFDPVDGSSVYSDTITISGRSGGATSVRVNNVAAQLADGSFAAQVTLQVGRNDIQIDCGDATATLTLYRYTDATITITSPANGFVSPTSTVDVSGTVTAGVDGGDVNTNSFTPSNGT